MKKLNLFLPVFTCFYLFLYQSTFSQSPYMPNRCGTPDFPSHSMAIFNSAAVPENLAASKIPVWIYFIELEQQGLSYSKNDARASISEINPYFSGLFEFSICGESTIQSTEFSILNVNEFNSLCDLVNSLPETLDDKCIKIFFVSDVFSDPGNYYIGFGWKPGLNGDFEHSGVALRTPSIPVVAHEIGHYFGLSHTFSGGQPQQFVSTDPIVCENTGDMLCDTPADLDEINFDDNCIDFSCAIPNQITCNDLTGLPYNPDPTLLMSYHLECADRFTSLQRLLMRTIFNADPEFEDLRNPDSECTAPKVGSVTTFCVNSLNSTTQGLHNLNINIKDGGSGNCNLLTNSDGFYTLSDIGLNCPPISPGIRKITPQKDPSDFDMPLPLYLASWNGLTAWDLSLISQHILNLLPFDSPYKFLAADVNYSGTVTNFDIVLSRSILLGQSKAFPVGSWRHVPVLAMNQLEFIPVFNSNNPFNATYVDPITNRTRAYKEDITNSVLSWMDNVTLNTNPNFVGFDLSNFESNWQFKSVKTGDIDCSAEITQFASNVEEFILTPQDSKTISLEKNQQKTIHVKYKGQENVAAYQLGISYNINDMSVIDILEGNQDIVLSEENFHIIENLTDSTEMLNSIWYSETGTPVNLNNQSIFKIAIQSKRNISDLYEHLDLSKFKPGVRFFNALGQEISDFELFLSDEWDENIVNQRGDEKHMIHSGLSQKQIETYPIPFTNAINMSFSSDFEELAKLQIFSADNTLIREKQVLLKVGLNNIDIDNLENITHGIYFYSIVSNNFNHTGKIIK